MSGGCWTRSITTIVVEEGSSMNDDLTASQVIAQALWDLYGHVEDVDDFGGWEDGGSFALRRLYAAGWRVIPSNGREAA